MEQDSQCPPGEPTSDIISPLLEQLPLSRSSVPSIQHDFTNHLIEWFTSGIGRKLLVLCFDSGFACLSVRPIRDSAAAAAGDTCTPCSHHISIYIQHNHNKPPPSSPVGRSQGLPVRRTQQSTLPCQTPTMAQPTMWPISAKLPCQAPMVCW